jgi:formylglycine-generating enzyme required for sulfatase activity
LLTEAEWEYSARAGSPTPFSTGQAITTAEANIDALNFPYAGSAKGIWRGMTVEVGSFTPNAFGIFDMHGNVFEWVDDCVHTNYLGAPTDGSAWTTGECRSRVQRGGSWLYGASTARSAYRTWDTPDNRGGFNMFGFRLARTLSP